ncbi:unnamed protein product, partial [Polarella glacialis]
MHPPPTSLMAATSLGPSSRRGPSDASRSFHSKGASWQDALGQLSKELSLNGRQPSVVKYNELLGACSRGKCWGHAVGVLAAMVARASEPDVISFSTVLNACARCSRWQQALGGLAEMGKVLLEPNVISYNSAVTACEKGLQWQLALGVLGQMTQKALQPDVISCNAAISACEKGASGGWAKALHLMKDMSRKGLERDTISYSAAISACEKGERWDQALALLSEMRLHALQFDLTSYNAAISACAKGGQWQSALGLMAEMQSLGYKPDVISYGAAISACEKGGRWEDAILLLMEMRTKELRPDVIHYTAVITACRRSGQWLRALELFNSMGRFRVDRNLVTYREAIGACETGLNWAVALDLLRESTQRANLELSGSAAFRAAVELCHACKQWAMALELITALLGRKVETCATLGVPYVHIVQAGSSIDCFKHVVLVLLLQQMMSETTEFTYVDTHAGRGVYDLTSKGAMQFQMFEDGLLKMDRWRAQGVDLPAPIAEYLAKQRGINRESDPSAALEIYLGSPVLAQQWLRPQDRMLVFDVSPDVHAALEKSVRQFAPPNGPADVRALQEESYNWLMQAPDDFLSGPGLVLIDPPYEPYSEYMAWNLVLLRRLRERWPTSCIAVWFPCFDAEQTTELYHCVRDLQLGAALVAQLTVRGLGKERLPSSGMLLVNPPAQAAELLESVLPFLGSMLEQKEGGVLTSVR